MVDLNAVFAFQREMIERDLTPFTDPGTRLELDGESRALSARWYSRGKLMEARFVLSPDGVLVHVKNQVLTYKSFMAGPEMADLLGLAKMILQTNSPGIFVQTQARLADQPSLAPSPAVLLLKERLASENSASVTRIVMVIGEAGAGKTRVLQKLIREQAQEYQLGRTDCLYLYINAQGRALARFNEALATELQDLRSLVTYHAVSALVRLGILVPVIDGFDELLGVGGYDDAFSSLTGFIEELSGQGQIVASARSSYYEQEFVARANTVSSLGAQAWTQEPVEVQSWGEGEFLEYVRLRAAEEHVTSNELDSLAKRVAGVFSDANAHLRKKPLFVAKTVDTVLKYPEFHGGDDLLKQLVAAYLERERKEKLLDSDGGTLLSAKQLELLFTNLAEEMWNQETRELDLRSIKEVAEYVLVTEGVLDSVQRVVVERMPTLAFLSPGEKTGSVAFEHEMFFSYFLGQVLGNRLLREGGAARVFLGRSVLPVEVATAALSVVDAIWPLMNPETAQRLLDCLADAGKLESPRSSQVRENGGLLAGAILKEATRRQGPIKGVKLARLVFPGGDLCGVELQGSELNRVEFRRVDLSKTRFVECKGTDVLLSEIIVDHSHTKLEIHGVDPASQIVGLRVRDKGLLRSLYDPNEIQSILEALGTVLPHEEGVSSVRGVAEPYIKILEKLVRYYRRTNPVCTADDNLRHVFRNPHWNDIERLLIKHGVVTRETRATGGQPKSFLRRQVLTDHIMAGLDRLTSVPSQVGAFWDELEKTHPLKA